MKASALALIAVLTLLSGSACRSGPRATPGPGAASAQELALMYQLINPAADMPSIIAEMGDSGNPSYVFALVEAMRFNYWPQETSQALERLTGQALGPDWSAWARWLWQQEDLPLPIGYDGWKGKFIRHFVGTNYKYLLHNGMESRIRLDEIVWSGLSWEAIPPLDHPESVPAEATYLEADEPVFGASIAGESRAYPVRFLERHQMVNDALGGVPVLVAYCPLSGSGIMYERPAGNREFLFRASGLLYRNNVLMYDGAQTLWSQFTGERMVRRAIDTDMRIDPLPMVASTWEAWLALHPDTTVLDISTADFREYAPGLVYGEYTASPEVMFPLPFGDERLEDKERAFGLTYGKETRVYRLRDVLDEVVVNDAVGDLKVVLVADPASHAVRAYRRHEHVFRPADVGQRGEPGAPAAEPVVKNELGQTWRADEDALVNLFNLAERLDRLPGRLAYWFAWYSFYPDLELYGED